MLKVIGIISYLPDAVEIRQQRFSKLCKLIETCSSLFNLPIYIVIQNYKKEELSYFNKYSKVYLSDNYSKCGIVEARRKLRNWFLQSHYDCLIMLDDDCEIVGTPEGAKKYLEEIEAHPEYFGMFRGSQLKLFSICRNIISSIDFDDINPENGDGFEDTIFVEKCLKKFPKQSFSFYNVQNLKETSLGVGDKLSTWYTSQNIQDMLENTERLKEEI